MNPFLRAVLWMLAIALAVLLLLLGAYFVHGSLEEFPTSEQQDKVRLVSGIGLLLFSGLEALVLFALWAKRPPRLR